MTLSPSNTTPVSGISNPAAIRKAVVLPQPDGPSRLTNSPGCKARSSDSRATVVPKVFRMPVKLSEVIRESHFLGNVKLVVVEYYEI